MSKERHDTLWMHLGDTTSTLDAMAQYTGPEGSLFTAITATHQSAGRGQGANTWESEPGQNLLLAVRMHPKRLEARRQYALAEAVAMAVRDTLATYADGFTVKWPNDVYWQHKKISGTLTQCQLKGMRIETCTMGTGVNLNQTRFVSNAPNPVSLKQITGRDADHDDFMWALLNALAKRVHMADGPLADRLHHEYMAALYRRQGMHAFRDSNGLFMAAIHSVTTEGHLVLRDDNGRLRTYAFKEVEHVETNGSGVKCGG